MTDDELHEMANNLIEFYDMQIAKYAGEMKISEYLTPIQAIFCHSIFNVFIGKVGKDKKVYLALIDEYIYTLKEQLMDAYNQYLDNFKEATNAMEADLRSN